MNNIRDERYLRQAIALAKQSRANGCHPFGTVIVSADDQVLAACESRKERGGDATQHSELSAVRLTSSAYPKELLAQATTEPCAMCAGAIYWGGIGRVVYGFPESRLYALTGNHPENPTLPAASAASTWSDRCSRRSGRGACGLLGSHVMGR
ncbi:MAG TPA: nucleoside deaminase [Xanthobacteraceae bacterium]